MYEITMYDLGGHLTEPRQVHDLVYEPGGILCWLEPVREHKFDLFIPYHRVYEVSRVA